MIPSHQPINDQGNKVSRALYNIKEEAFSKLEPTSLLKQAINSNSSLLTPLKTHKSYDTYSKQHQEDVISLIKDGGNGMRTLSSNKISKPLVEIKEEEISKVEPTSLLTQALDNNTSLLTPLKAPKSYGTYSKQQQEDVIAFIKDGNSLRTAEKVFGIPKSTMHCWLKKIHNSADTLNTTTVDQFSDLNIDTQFPYTNTTEEYTGTKVKSSKDSHTHQRKTSPSSQIVIEESELIRFLQSNEGMEMIAKAYSVNVHDFVDFIRSSKMKTQDSLKGLLVSTGQPRPVEVIGFLPQIKTLEVKESTTENRPVSPNSVRKRILQNDQNSDKTCLPVAVLQKKIKVEQSNVDNNNIGESHNSNNNNKNNNNNNLNNNSNTNSSSSSLLASLLTKGSYKNDSDWKPVMPTKLVLTTKQYLAASKIISAAQPNLVNTFLSQKPLSMPADLVNARPQTITQQANSVITCNDDSNNNAHLLDPTSELSLGYPKITNPVSIKAERLDSEITLPCDVSPSHGVADCIRTFTPVIHSITRPTVTSNNTATLNLNEINRTQSERELMAMVDGDNVSADELCAEFKETLELSNWVDNETWYMDQYLQHFQVSPAITSPGSSLPDAESYDLDEEDNTGLTFVVDKDKDKDNIISSAEMETINNIVPVTVNIFEPYKSSGEVWTTLSSPGLLSSPRIHNGHGLLSSSSLNDELLSSPRIHDGLLCSPGLSSPRLHDRGLLNSPRKEQLLTRLQETGLDPNLIQPNFLTNNRDHMDDHPTVLRGTKFHSAFYRTDKTYEKPSRSAFTKSVT